MTVIAMFYKALLLQPVHGHRSSEAPSPFRQTRDGEIHFTEDPEINFASIAFNSYIPKTVGQTSVKGNLFCLQFAPGFPCFYLGFAMFLFCSDPLPVFVTSACFRPPDKSA